jgi:hypothetical protein
VSTWPQHTHTFLTQERGSRVRGPGTTSSDGVLLPVQRQHGGEREEAATEAGAREDPDREETEQPRGAG